MTSETGKQSGPWLRLDLWRSLEAIRPSHRFDVACQGTVPMALLCAESTSLEGAVRNAVSLD